MSALEIVFWCAALAVFYTFLGSGGFGAVRHQTVSP